MPPPIQARISAISIPTSLRAVPQAPLLIVDPPLAADRAVSPCDVLAIIPDRLEALDGGTLLQTPVQSFVIPSKTAFWAESRGDVLAVSPETASFAITPTLATENIWI